MAPRCFALGCDVRQLDVRAPLMDFRRRRARENGRSLAMTYPPFRAGATGRSSLTTR